MLNAYKSPENFPILLLKRYPFRFKDPIAMIKVRKSPPCPISVHHLASFSSVEDDIPTPELSPSLISPPLTPEYLDTSHDPSIITHGIVGKDVPMTFLMYKLFW